MGEIFLEGMHHCTASIFAEQMNTAGEGPDIIVQDSGIGQTNRQTEEIFLESMLNPIIEDRKVINAPPIKP